MKQLKAIFLFTASDFKTIVFPQAMFAISSSFAGPVLLEAPLPEPIMILQRAPLVIFWNWINLLFLDISNQRQLSSIEEDKLNKPWRPLPSGLMSVQSAQRLLYFVYPTAIVASIYLENLPQCFALIFLNWVYNDLGGSDWNPWVRNMANAAGYTSFASGALAVASSGATLNFSGYLWFLIIFLFISSTVQMQDVPDQEGDRQRGRRTVCLELGDRAARWTVALAVMGWSIVIPTFWSLSLVGYVVPIVLGFLISYRVLSQSTVPEDQRTYKLYNVWMVVVYLSPVWRISCS